MPIKNSLNDKQLKAIQILVYEGLSKQDTAIKAGVARETMSDWFKNPMFLEQLNEEMRLSFSEIAAIAKERALNIMKNTENDSVALKAAHDFMDRAGYGATQKVEQTNRDITVELITKPKE